MNSKVKILVKKILRVKTNIINTSIIDNIDDNMKFGHRYGILLSKSHNDYLTKKFERRQIIKSIIIKSMTLLTSIRYLMTSLVAKKWMIVLMSDAMYLLGYNRLIDYPLVRMSALMFSLFALVIFLMTSVIFMDELEGKFPVISFWIKYRQSLLPVISKENTHRINFLMGMFTKIIYLVFWPLNLISIALITGITLQALFEQGSEFNCLSAIFWTVCLCNSFIHFYALVCIGFVISWTISTIYLKYKFRQITDSFNLRLGFSDRSLFGLITEHNNVCLLTEELNRFYRIMIFLLYYFASPALMILMTLTHSENVVTVAKFVSAFIFLIVFGVVFCLNINSSRVSGSARMPIKYLYRFMAENRLNRRQRLKTMAFIERLSGPDIGFYCLDLFPMNSYEFYLYVANCVKNYILILEYIPRPDL